MRSIPFTLPFVHGAIAIHSLEVHISGLRLSSTPATQSKPHRVNLVKHIACPHRQVLPSES